MPNGVLVLTQDHPSSGNTDTPPREFVSVGYHLSMDHLTYCQDCLKEWLRHTFISSTAWGGWSRSTRRTFDCAYANWSQWWCRRDPKVRPQKVMGWGSQGSRCKRPFVKVSSLVKSVSQMWTYAISGNYRPRSAPRAKPLILLQVLVGTKTGFSYSIEWHWCYCHY